MPTPKELARAYFDGLKDAYIKAGAQETWEHFASIVHGAGQ